MAEFVGIAIGDNNECHRVDFVDLARRDQAILSRHVHVCEDEIIVLFGRLLHGNDTILRFVDSIAVVAKDVDEQIANDLCIVDYQYRLYLTMLVRT